MGYFVETVTFLYSVSLSMSAFFQNNLLLRKACNSSVPFGECTEGEAHAQHVVYTMNSWKTFIQYTIPVVLIILAGTLFSVTVLSHRQKINDTIIGCIACTFDILAAICYVFVNEPWQLYIIPLVDIFHGTALAISTSLTSKIVDNEKLGIQVD